MLPPCGPACDPMLSHACQGFNVTVGGGMGRTHRNEDTFPRIADPLGYVDKDDVFHIVGVI